MFCDTCCYSIQRSQHVFKSFCWARWSQWKHCTLFSINKFRGYIRWAVIFLIARLRELWRSRDCVLMIVSLWPYRPSAARYFSYHILAETYWSPISWRYFEVHFLGLDIWISIESSLKFLPKDPINNIQTLGQIMAWGRPDDKLLSESMMVSLQTHICVSRLYWVNGYIVASRFRETWR